MVKGTQPNKEQPWIFDSRSVDQLQTHTLSHVRHYRPHTSKLTRYVPWPDSVTWASSIQGKMTVRLRSVCKGSTEPEF